MGFADVRFALLAPARLPIPPAVENACVLPVERNSYPTVRDEVSRNHVDRDVGEAVDFEPLRSASVARVLEGCSVEVFHNIG